MEKISSYGIGCGSLLLIAGVIDLIGMAWGWGESNRSIFQILKIVEGFAGSQTMGAGIFIVGGAILILLGWGIPEILRKDEPEKKESAGSGKAWGGPVEQPFLEGEQSKANKYLNFVENNLLRNGFSPVMLAENNKAFYKKEARSSEFYFIPKYTNESLSPEAVKKLSQNIFEVIRKNKRANTLYGYPVIVSEQVPVDVQKFIQSYHSTHMAQFEFPVVVDLSARKLFYYTGTPLWGAAMYGGIRDNAKTLLKFP